ncbi:hypothetical protein GCG54_00015139 [Colletotrichum gloeosporioides]|uniref:FAD-binding FR-type domain-containing protein n=1 Tax=Colletotrichum gloeosporioides TaxID=474922 RepID=A0A8H4FH21_COLGL|nr:uncharacterized protein GCG54_00015139 [Colletotrichum gloeosporioides]KAF3801917.1 hypothetical protein GCG54_00015139 [Colletotrichum gloeosporioides]
MATSVIVVLLVLALGVSAQVGSGVIGFGISLYQDLCCQACHDSLSSLWLTCTTFSNATASSMPGMSGMSNMPGMNMPMATTSPECYASNTPWLQTMAFCIQQHCTADGYPADKQAECFSNQAVGGVRSPTFEQSMPFIAPTIELAANATWLNITSLVNSEVYSSTYGSEGEFRRSEYLHSTYALALYLIVIGGCLVCGVLTQLAAAFPSIHRRLQASRFWPKLREYIFLPGLVGSRRLEPLPGQVGYVPRRTISIFIAIYITLNVVFSAIGFGSFQPNINFKSKGFELCEYVGNRTGILSLVNAGLAILFAGRNNLLIALTGWSLTTFITLHRWVARIATVQAIAHSVVYTIAYWQPGYDGFSAYVAKVAEPFYYWGIIATICFSLAMGVAILPMRINFYETFLALHIVLVAAALAACWYHIVPHFTLAFGYQTWLYICFAFWAFDRTARILRIAMFNHIGGSQATLEAIPESKVMQLTVYPRSMRGFGPGQHTFLYFPGLGMFWQSHPFSVSGWKTRTSPSFKVIAGVAPTGTNKTETKNNSDIVVLSNGVVDQGPMSVSFLIHPHSGITARLQQRLASFTNPTMDITVYTEGPYAGHRAKHLPLLNADTVLCIVGGIGITGVLGYIQEYATALNNADEISQRGTAIMNRTKRFILAWSAREISLIEYVRQKYLDGAAGIESSFWCTDATVSKLPFKKDGRYEVDMTTTGVILGRMHVETLVKSCLEKECRTAVLVCGPGRMADEVTKHVVNGVKDGFTVELIEESFAW